MSVLQTKILALQRQQEKVERLQFLKSYVLCLDESAAFVGVVAEIKEVMIGFIDQVVAKIEGGDALGTSDRSGTVHLTSAETQIVKQAAEAAVKGVPAFDPSSVSHQDKIAFAIQYRSLGEKVIQGIDISGADVKGPVIKLDAPYIFVRNDLNEGQVARVLPSNISQ